MNLKRLLFLSCLFIRDDFSSTIVLGSMAVVDSYCTSEHPPSTLYVITFKTLLYYFFYRLVHCTYNQLYAGKFDSPKTKKKKKQAVEAPFLF